MSKGRAIIFVINNYTPEELNFLDNELGPKVNGDSDPIRFIAYQQETGASGTPHIQGWAYRDSPLSIVGWKRELGTKRVNIQWKSAKSTFEQCTAYTQKEETRDPGTEPRKFGTEPQQGSRTDVTAITALAVDPSKSMREVANSDPDTFIKYHKGLAVLRTVNTTPRNHKTTVYWFYGDTGSGKTRLASHLAPEAYWKMGENDWWDGYDPMEHEDVIIDDFRASSMHFTQVLRLFDRYPLLAQVKGATIQFVSKRIFITSPRPPQSTWRQGTVGRENIEQVVRRLENISNFIRDGDTFVIRRISGEGEHSLHDLPDWLVSFDSLEPERQRRIIEKEEQRLRTLDEHIESSRAAGFFPDKRSRI